jgi:hypothetical protein
MTRISFLICLLIAAPVEAQNPIANLLCAPAKQMQQKLVHQFGSSRRATGLRNPEEVFEIWTDPRGDWAMVIAYASGTSCIVAMGDHWQETSPANPT